MYLWNVQRLKSELRAAHLPQQEGLKYILASSVTFTLLVELSLRFPATLTSADQVASVASLLIVLLGTRAAYSANGGSEGTDFVARYLALGWVVGIRVLVASSAGFLLAAFVSGIVAPGVAESDAFWNPVGALFTVAIIGVLYWRLAAHVGDLRQGPSGSPDDVRPAAS